MPVPPILFVLPLGLLALIGRVVEQSWMAPGAFFALTWSVWSAIPIVLAPEEYVSPWAMLYIISAAAMVLAGSCLAVRFLKGAKSEGYLASRVRLGTLRKWMLATTLLAFCFVPVVIWSAGFELKQLFSRHEILGIIAYFITNRYFGDAAEPLLSRPFLICVYLAPLFGGMDLALSKAEGWRKKIAFMSLLPALAITGLRSEKWPTIVAITLLVGSYSGIKRSNNEKLLNKPKEYFYIFIFILLLFTFFSWSQYTRFFDGDDGQIYQTIMNKMYSYGFSHITVFSHWFDDNALSLNPLYGARAFSGIFDFFGLKVRIPGAFNDFITLSNGDNSNVTTIFRYLIEDISLPGSLLFWFLVGLVCRICFNYINFHVFCVGYIIYLASVVLSFATPLFSSNTVCLAFFVLAVCGRSWVDGDIKSSHDSGQLGVKK